MFYRSQKKKKKKKNHSPADYSVYFCSKPTQIGWWLWQHLRNTPSSYWFESQWMHRVLAFLFDSIFLATFIARTIWCIYLVSFLEWPSDSQFLQTMFHYSMEIFPFSSEWQTQSPICNNAFSRYQTFRKTNISYPLIDTSTCAYQGIKMLVFWKILRTY